MGNIGSPDSRKVCEMTSDQLLAVVVIGKNEAKNLPRSFQSIRTIPMECDLVFVDAASKDESCEVASRHGATVIRLCESRYLNAATGRSIGLEFVDAHWVLFLDGDMALQPPFAKRIPIMIEETPGRTTAGFVGSYTNVYPDGTSRENVLRQNPDNLRASTFGGAVLLRRDSVLLAGNWDHHISSYEELDLHMRLRVLGLEVNYVPEAMVVHYTSNVRPWQVLFRMFFPIGRSRQRAGGIGQVMRAWHRRRALLQLAWLYPEPFLYLSVVLLGIILGGMPFEGARWSLILVPAALLVMALRQRLPLAVVYLSFPVRILLGWFQYPREWVPRYSVYSRSDNSG